MPKRTREQAGGGGGDGDDGSSELGDEQPESDPSTGIDPSDNPQHGAPAVAAARAPANPLVDDDALLEEEDDGEDLVGEGMEADYRPMGRLDEYEEDGLDNAEYEDDVDARVRAEAELNQRDANEQYGRRRAPRALLDSSGDEADEGFQRRRHQAAQAAEGEALEDDQYFDPTADLDNLDAFDPSRMSLEEWIEQPSIQLAVRRLFHRFLSTFDSSKDASGNPVPNGRPGHYLEAVKQMCLNNQEALDVSYPHMSQEVPTLAIWVADSPAMVIPIFNLVATKFVLRYFPDYDRIHPEVRVCIVDLPISDSIRDLRHVHLNCLVKVSGTVVARSPVLPQLKMVRFDCAKCGGAQPEIVQRQTATEVKPNICVDCQSKGPFILNVERTIYRNYQKLVIQESPGTVPPGRLPRQKEVVLLGDLIDTARPGEEIEVTGTYTNNYDMLNTKHNGFPVFSTMIEANAVHKRNEQFAVHKLTDEEVSQIRRLAQDPSITQRIIDSIAPSIYGHQDVKRAIALSLFGGQDKDVHNKHRVRGDINVLLLGDPGTAKSQFLKYVEKTAHRAVYANGQGASGVGLTASVRRDPVSREWMLEGGALVLADRGVCLIDEFDKMNDQDRTSIHEAMEQQSISVSKAGIVTSLQARCAVMAAANPVGGRYQPANSFADNVDLSEPILSRFDVTCILRDEANPVIDNLLAEFVLDSHDRAHPRRIEEAKEAKEAEDADAGGDAATEAAGGRAPIPQALLQKYIVYARTNCRPVLQDVDVDKVAKFYIDLRRESSRSGGIVVAVRHLESIIRLAEVRRRARWTRGGREERVFTCATPRLQAAARMQLRSFVRDDDIDLAISVMLRSFISSQKSTVAQAMERKFSRYLNLRRDVDELLLFVLNR